MDTTQDSPDRSLSRDDLDALRRYSELAKLGYVLFPWERARLAMELIPGGWPSECAESLCRSLIGAAGFGGPISGVTVTPTPAGRGTMIAGAFVDAHGNRATNLVLVATLRGFRVGGVDVVWSHGEWRESLTPTNDRGRY